MHLLKQRTFRIAGEDSSFLRLAIAGDGLADRSLALSVEEDRVEVTVQLCYIEAVQLLRFLDKLLASLSSSSSRDALVIEEGGARLRVGYDNRGDPYVEGVQFELTAIGGASAFVFLADSDAAQVLKALNEYFGIKA